MASLLQLLSSKPSASPRPSQARSIDAQYQQCKAEIQDLVRKIKAKLDAKDEKALSKLNEQLDAADESKEATPNRKARFQMQRSLTGHQEKVYALKWFRDSQSIVSASQDGSLIVWDLASAKKKIGIPLRHGWVMTVDVSPNGQFVASGGLDNLCSVFDISDQLGWAADLTRPYRELQQHEGYVSCARFTDDEHVLTASGDANCILWDIEYQQPVSVFCGHTGDVESVAHNEAGGRTFVSGSIDMTARLWDYRVAASRAASGGCVQSFAGHQSDINSVAWFPDYRAFGTASDDGCCRLYDVAAYQTLNVYGAEGDADLKHSSGVTSLSFSRSGYYLVAGYDDEMGALAWNTVTAKVEAELPHAQRVASLDFQPNGYSLATGCWDRAIRVWV